MVCSEPDSGLALPRGGCGPEKGSSKPWRACIGMEIAKPTLQQSNYSSKSPEQQGWHDTEDLSYWYQGAWKEIRLQGRYHSDAGNSSCVAITEHWLLWRHLRWCLVSIYRWVPLHRLLKWSIYIYKGITKGEIVLLLTFTDIFCFSDILEGPRHVSFSPAKVRRCAVFWRWNCDILQCLKIARQSR